MIRPNILILDYFKLKNRRYAHFIAFYARFTAYNISYNILLMTRIIFWDSQGHVSFIDFEKKKYENILFLMSFI